MSVLEFFSWFFAFLTFVVVLDQWHKKRVLKNVNIPGPIGVPLLGSVIEGIMYSNSELLPMIRQYFGFYGPMILAWGLGKPFIHVGGVEHAEIILSSSVHIDKGFLYTFFHPWLGTGLLTSTGQKWHKRRKMLTPAFHFTILNSFTDIFQNNAEILTKKLESYVDKEPFDIFPLFSACTLDIICEAAMGVKMKVQENTSNEYIRSVHTITEMIVKRVLSPALYPDFIHRFSKNYREQQKSLKVLHEMSLKVIQQRISERKERSQSDDTVSEKKEKAVPGERIKKAFLDMLLDASENDNHSLSVQDIREEVDTFMFEGHDTTSAALGWVIFCVGNHPEVQQQIYEELDDIFGDSDRLPDTNDLARMKYLECVLKEAMRLFPPVPILSRRLVVDTKMGEYEIPANTTVLLHVHQIHRSDKYFSNPEQFNPANFSSYRESNLNPYGYVPFSAGPRNCIGQKFAILEEKILLSSFFRKFGVESVEKLDTILSAPDTILRPTNGIFIKLKRRK